MDDDKIEFKFAQLELRKAVEDLRKFEGKSQGPPYCSFCRRGKGQYSCLIEGNSSVRICDRCVIDSYALILGEMEDE